MYKILHFDGLGVHGRQNELIEMALTHGFDAVEIDATDLLGRHETMGKDFACQFLLSAKTDMGTFDLPVDFGCSDEDYAKFMAKVDTIIDLASTLGCKVCVASIAPTSESTPFQENFERHRTRLHDVAERFAESGLRIGLYLNAVKAQTAKGEHKFIQTAEEILTLVKTVGHANVGLCLDTFQWQIGSGAMDQLSDLDCASLTEVRLGDVADEADLASIKAGDRRLPGESANSMAIRLMEHLQNNNYEGAVSVATNQAMFAGQARDKIVSAISQRIDRLIANEPLVDPEEPEVDAEAVEESTEETTETKETSSATA